jgi:hypothetical protein
MQALFRLKTVDCKIGPKIDDSASLLSAKSTSRQQEESDKKSVSNQQKQAQSKSWLESRLNYRLLVHKMIKEMESHCEDVIFTVQSCLNMAPNAFIKLCDPSQISNLDSNEKDLLEEKQNDVGS